MEEGKPRSNEVPEITDLTQEEILRLLDVATDFKIRRETEADGAAGEAGDNGAQTKEAADCADHGEKPVPDTAWILTDLLTIQEHFGYFDGIAFGCPAGAKRGRTDTWKAVCEKMEMEWLADEDMPELPEDVPEEDMTAVAMETDADEQQLYLYERSVTDDTVQAVLYALCHASDKEEATDET